MEQDGKEAVGTLGLLFASLIVTLGTYWAFERAAPDFTVFYTAWSLVLTGRGSEIYQVSTDRFLYAPGFAWLMAPLALLPRWGALAIWCFAKAGVVGYLVREFQLSRRGGIVSAGLAGWGVVLLSRPLLIDFQYGQINILILGGCCWALLGHFKPGKGGWADFVSWSVVAVVAVTKIFPLPILLLPFIPSHVVSRERVKWERLGLIAGLALILLLPLVSLSFKDALTLMMGWKDALLARGLPFESHNQSLSALLHRWFSGEPVHVVALGMHPVSMGWSILSEKTIRLLSLSWVFLSAGTMIAWLMRRGYPTPLRWAAVMVALLVLPSHLVWKPYFVFFLPVGCLLAGATLERESNWRFARLVFAFLAMNIFGFDLLGAAWGARLEAMSQMLWAGLIYLWVAFEDARSAPHGIEAQSA